MSGSGKSHWSKKLQKIGFKRFCCDALIEEKLGEELKAQGYSGIQDVAKWMGQPFDLQYKKSSKKYLQFEKEILEEIFTYINKLPFKGDIIIDTTGSVVYLDEELLGILTKISKVIYLETPDSVKEEMYQLYRKDPKPVIWGDAYNRAKSEDAWKALAKCYPKLLAYRSKKYKKLAHIILDYHTLRSKNFTTELFLQAIQ